MASVNLGDNQAVSGQAADPAAFELEIARLIAVAVNLECKPEQIDPAAPLFGDGLGLDSIDLLEIALAVSQNYGFSLRSDDPDNRKIFSSLRSFAAHIARHRTK